MKEKGFIRFTGFISFTGFRVQEFNRSKLQGTVEASSTLFER
jgi:hypothetical protein